jgi:hypothetical protein
MQDKQTFISAHDGVLNAAVSYRRNASKLPIRPGCPQILTRNFCKGENAFMLCRRCGAPKTSKSSGRFTTSSKVPVPV